MANGTKVATCCCCGQVLPPKIKVRGLIKQRIYELVVQRPGILTRDLMGLVYADDPNGGPESDNIIRVHVKQLNKQLASHSLRIRGDYSGGYRLLKL